MVKSIDLFEENEAKYIAKLILNNRLKRKILNAETTITYNENAKQTISDIERIEFEWKYLENDSSQTFGRKQKNEPLMLWSIPKTTANVLSYLALYSNAKNILEIGTSAGYSTIHLANVTNYTDGIVHTIENHPEKIKLANQHFKESNLEHKIKLLSSNAKGILSSWNELIDFVFLDADKENYGTYLDLLLPHMKKDGLIIADNVNDYGHMMEDYLQKVSGSHFPNSRTYENLQSTYIASLDNGLMVTQILKEVER